MNEDNSTASTDTELVVSPSAPARVEDLVDWLGDLDYSEALTLFETLLKADPLERTTDGDWKYSDEERKLLARAKDAYDEAGLGE